MKTAIKVKVEKGSSVESMETRYDLSLKDMTLGKVEAMMHALEAYSEFSHVAKDLYISLKFTVQDTPSLHYLETELFNS